MSGEKSKIIALKFFFAVAIVMFVVCVVMLPWMVKSILQEAQHAIEDYKFPFSPADIVAEPTYTRIHVDIVGIDEVNRLATLRVNGFHTCADAVKCGTYKERVIFFSVDEADMKSETIPPSVLLEIPSNSEEISKRIMLPIQGNILTFPFDKYKLGIGVVLQRELPDKTVLELTPAETKGKLLMTLQEQVPKIKMTQMKSVDPATVKPLKGGFDYAYVNELFFVRPPHMVIVISLVTVLSLAVVIFSVLTRPFDTMVLNVGATIFGIWGIRSLTLGGYPPDVTILDYVLTTTVVLMLLSLTFRGVNHFHERAGMRLFPWAIATKPEPKEATQVCPECLTKVPAKAKRCSACTSTLPTDT